MAMINTTIEMNGVLTPAAIDVEQVQHAGDEAYYRIDYGNRLVEVGGVMNVEAVTTKKGVVAGASPVGLPFSHVYTAQVTGLDGSASVNLVKAEQGYEVHVTTNASTATVIPVKWFAKGVI